MNTTGKTIIVVTVSVGAILALIFASGSIIGATQSGGLMGDRGMGSSGWMWIPALIWLFFPMLVMISFGAMLVWLTFDHSKKHP